MKLLLLYAPNLRKWRSAFKTAVFGARSSESPLVDRRGTLILSVDEKESLVLAYFDAKQDRDSFQQTHSCDFSPVLCSVAFWSIFVRSLLLDLDPNDGNDPAGLFPHFHKQMARELLPKLVVILRYLVKRGQIFGWF